MNLVPLSVTIVTSRGRYCLQTGPLDFSAGGYELTLRDEPGISASVRARADSSLMSVEFDYTLESRGELSLLKNGFQSWSHTGVFTPDTRQRRQIVQFARNLQENPNNAPSGKKGVAHSEMFVLLRDSKSEDMLVAHEIRTIRSPMAAVASYIGVTKPEKSETTMEQFVSFRSDLRKKRMKIIIDIDKRFAAGESLELARVSFAKGEGLSILDEWSLRNSLVRPNALPFLGWCSWYHYYTNISARILRKNLARAKDLHLPFEVFQIDDGYQRAVGDWLVQTGDFSGEMPALSESIRSTAYQPGIWIAPFIASKNSELAKKGDYFIKTKYGRRVSAGFNPNWGGTFFALDTTHPEVQRYIKECIATIVHEWHYRYLKLDFLYAAALPGRRFDETKTRAQIYKDAVALVREAAGEEAFFLACGAPLSASVGLFEAMRIGCDVAPRWGEGFPDKLLLSDSNVETRGAIRDSLYRAFMKNCFFMVDPDCLLLRAEDNELSLTEQQTLANAMALCGGLFFLSDDLCGYGAREMKILEPAVELWRACREGRLWVLNWYSSSEPLVCMNTAGYLGIFNLTDEELHCTVPDTVCTPDGRIFDVREFIARRSLLVRPHGSVVFGKIGELKR